MLKYQEKAIIADNEAKTTLRITSDMARFKMDLCLSYLENNGKCKEGLECKHAHGAIELRREDEAIEEYLDSYLKRNPTITSLKIYSKAFSVRQHSSASFKISAMKKYTSEDFDKFLFLPNSKPSRPTTHHAPKHYHQNYRSNSKFAYKPSSSGIRVFIPDPYPIRSRKFSAAEIEAVNPIDPHNQVFAKGFVRFESRGRYGFAQIFETSRAEFNEECAKF